MDRRVNCKTSHGIATAKRRQGSVQRSLLKSASSPACRDGCVAYQQTQTRRNCQP
jgi:hypothetical protein